MSSLPDLAEASTRVFQRSLPNSQSKLSTCSARRFGTSRGSLILAKEIRRGAVLLLVTLREEAKWGPSESSRTHCAHAVWPPGRAGLMAAQNSSVASRPTAVQRTTRLSRISSTHSFAQRERSIARDGPNVKSYGAKPSTAAVKFYSGAGSGGSGLANNDWDTAWSHPGPAARPGRAPRSTLAIPMPARIPRRVRWMNNRHRLPTGTGGPPDIGRTAGCPAEDPAVLPGGGSSRGP